jgi:hypothetical protein
MPLKAGWRSRITVTVLECTPVMRHVNFCDRVFAFGVSGVLGEREVALEFEGRAVAESGVEALRIVVVSMKRPMERLA